MIKLTLAVLITLTFSISSYSLEVGFGVFTKHVIGKQTWEDYDGTVRKFNEDNRLISFTHETKFGMAYFNNSYNLPSFAWFRDFSVSHLGNVYNQPVQFKTILGAVMGYHRTGGLPLKTFVMPYLQVGEEYSLKAGFFNGGVFSIILGVQL